MHPLNRREFLKVSAGLTLVGGGVAGLTAQANVPAVVWSGQAVVTRAIPFLPGNCQTVDLCFLKTSGPHPIWGTERYVEGSVVTFCNRDYFNEDVKVGDTVRVVQTHDKFLEHMGKWAYGCKVTIIA